jgi:hypothetical protein
MQPGNDETVVRVEERFADRIRAIVHAIPVTYGAGAGLAVGAEALGGAVPGVALALTGGAVGLGIGRVIWNLMRRASRRRVESLATRIGDEASRLAGAVPSGSSGSEPGEGP